MSEQIEYSSGMTGEEEGERRIFSASVFFSGLAVILMGYGALAGWLWHKAPQTEAALRGKLAAESVLIERPELTMPAPGVMAPATGTTEAPVSVGEALPQGEAAPLPAETAAPVATPQPVEAQPQINSGRGFLPDGLTLLPSGLAASPVDGLLKVTANGRIPTVREADKLTSFKAYRRPFNFAAAANKPLIAIIVTDLGLSQKVTDLAVENLPADVTFSYSPYAADLDAQIAKSRGAGHEAWLTLPMEPQDYPLTDPGPLALLVGAPEQQNIERLQLVLSRASGGLAGLVATPESAFLKSNADMRPAMTEIYASGLGFADISMTPAVTPQSMALSTNAPYAAADIILDQQGGRESIKRALADLEKTARTRNAAIGVIRPSPASIQEVLTWIKTLEAKGFALAPLSAMTGY